MKILRSYTEYSAYGQIDIDTVEHYDGRNIIVSTIIGNDGSVAWPADSIGRALGYGNDGMDVNRLINNSPNFYENTSHYTIDNKNVKNKYLLNQYGMCEVMRRTKKPYAKEVRDFLTDKVTPIDIFSHDKIDGLISERKVRVSLLRFATFRYDGEEYVDFSDICKTLGLNLGLAVSWIKYKYWAKYMVVDGNRLLPIDALPSWIMFYLEMVDVDERCKDKVLRGKPDGTDSVFRLHGI